MAHKGDNFFCLVNNFRPWETLTFIWYLYHYVFNTISRDKQSEVTQSCPTLCDPVDCSPPGSSLHGILQARTLEWVSIFFSMGSSQPRDGTRVFHISGRRFNLWATREALVKNRKKNSKHIPCSLCYMPVKAKVKHKKSKRNAEELCVCTKKKKKIVSNMKENVVRGHIWRILRTIPTMLGLRILA